MRPCSGICLTIWSTNGHSFQSFEIILIFTGIIFNEYKKLYAFINILLNALFTYESKIARYQFMHIKQLFC